MLYAMNSVTGHRHRLSGGTTKYAMDGIQRDTRLSVARKYSS